MKAQPAGCYPDPNDASQQRYCAEAGGRNIEVRKANRHACWSPPPPPPVATGKWYGEIRRYA